MEVRRVALSVIPFVFLALSLPSVSHGSSGFLESFSGAVYLKTKVAGRWAPADKGAAIEPGDRVKTGGDGRALVKLSDGTKLTIANLSELEISGYSLRKSERSGSFFLSSGKMRAAVSIFPGRTDFKVKTPTAVSGVRGTDFIVMNQGEANVFFGVDGSVEVSGERDRPVALTTGTMTESTAGSEAIPPVVVEPGTALAEARADLEAATDVDAPVVWERVRDLPDLLARWNINYGHYLADSARFREALDVFEIAFDLTGLPGIKAEARLERGTVYSRNMNDPGKALSEYTDVIERYKAEPFLENAVYSAGLVKMEMKDKDGALGLFRRYIADYPEGSHRSTVDIFIKELEK
ncbi:MAG: FecR domain-containing protein [Deltaproteobacteria bacterium]|nr:FecR domain-containing protein [Deltaproteobacteria bacterium]